MTRSRLHNKFLTNPNSTNRLIFTKYRNYCTKLFRIEKRKYYSNLDIRSIIDNKRFWKTIKPMFSDNFFTNQRINLVEKEMILSSDQEIAETFNTFFSNTVSNLNIKGLNIRDNTGKKIIFDIINRFKDHSSRRIIKENIDLQTKFSHL